MSIYAFREADGWISFVEDGVITTLPDEEGDTTVHARLAAWIADGGEIADGPPPAPPPTKEQLAAYAAAKRWQVETGGITVGGAAIDTSRDRQAMITGAYTYSQANPSEIVKFKAASGWVDLDAATLAAIATAVGAHVQACFAAEASVAAEIEAGTITTTAEIEAANWPA